MRKAILLSLGLMWCVAAAAVAQSVEPLVEFDGASGGALAVSNDGKWLAIGAEYKGPLKLFDLAKRKYVATLEDVDGVYVSVDFSPDGKLLAVLRVTTDPPENNLSVWNVAAKKRVWETKEGASWAKFSPDGKRLAAGKFSFVRFYQPKTGALLQDVRVHPEAQVGEGEYAAAAKLFVTAGDEDRKVSLWSVATGKAVNAFAVEGDEISGLAVSDDGVLVAVSQAGKVSVYESRSGQLKWSQTPAEEAIVSLDFRPRSKELATAGQDGAARIWDALAGTELQTIQPGHGMVQAVQYTPDGSDLIVGSSGSTAIYSAYPRVESAPYRTWQSSTGNFSVEARLIGQDGNQVHLIRKGDQKEIVVPLERLSQADRTHVAEALRSPSGKTSLLSYQLYEHIWKTGDEPQALISPEQGIAILAEIAGDFSSPTTSIEVGLSSDKHWQLAGKTEGAYIVARAYTVEELNRALFSDKVEVFSWSAGQAPIKMLRKDEGICCLSGISGALHGYGEEVRVHLVEDEGSGEEYWVLDGHSAQPQLSAKAVALRWKDPEKVIADVTEEVWHVGSEAKSVLPLGEGLCFFGSVSGNFVGGGEIVRLTNEEGAWHLSGQSGQSELSARALVVRIQAKP
ncbi:MAG: SHD1 domain-containing protein [Aureliella sp.]